MKVEVFGRNHAMKLILGESFTDEFKMITATLIRLRAHIRTAQLNEQQIKTIKEVANELVHDLQKGLMNARPSDSRIHCLSSRSESERTPDTAD